MPKRKASKLDVDAVLAGRVRPSAGELLDLIHRENPTGRELDAREVERRYARKARLQSLLVRRFADELDVSQDASSPGTASLQHHGQGRDGCHAVVATLDEDARAWVQRQLDLAAQDAPEAEPPVARSNSRPAVRSSEGIGENATLEGLLRQASTALQEYDYPGAQAALEQALEASGGAAGPAAALLEVLVDTLGDDAGALGLEPMLGNGALSDARVRGFLALAAARSSLEDRALSMVRGIGDEQAATVYAALAASALRAGDADRAARYLEQANRCDASCMSIRGVAEELDRARAAARGPAESELMSVMAAGRAAEAEKLASEVAARWPESEVARRVRRELEERRRNEGIARRVAEAEQALAQGDAVTALARLGQAAAAAEGAEREAIERRASDIEAAERERRATDQVEQVLAMLQGSDPTDGLERYAGLEDALRRRVRALSARAELDWLDRMAIARGTDRAKVAAAIAVEGARTALPRSPEAALELLAPHQTILERVPEARRIQSAAEGAVRAAKLEEMREKIGKARAALAAGEASDALATLEAVTLRELPEDDRAEVAVIHASATRVVDRQRRAEESVRLRAAGRLFEARTLAEGLAAGGVVPFERRARPTWSSKRLRPAHGSASWRPSASCSTTWTGRIPRTEATFRFERRGTQSGLPTSRRARGHGSMHRGRDLRVSLAVGCRHLAIVRRRRGVHSPFPLRETRARPRSGTGVRRRTTGSPRKWACPSCSQVAKPTESWWPSSRRRDAPGTL